MSVIAGVDDSPTSRLVVARAIEQARWRGTEVHIVHVGHFPTVYVDVPVDWPNVIEAHREAVWSGVEEVVSRADVPVTRVDLEGYPPDALVAYATENGASLLVLGTRGRGELASLLLGSTSHRAIQLARCDVLVVRPEEQ